MRMNNQTTQQQHHKSYPMDCSCAWVVSNLAPTVDIAYKFDVYNLNCGVLIHMLFVVVLVFVFMHKHWVVSCITVKYDFIV